MNTVPTSLRDILADTLEISPDEIVPSLSAADVPNWDSFRHLQIILALEGEYGMQFDPQQIPDLMTVAALTSALQGKGVKFEQ